MGELTASLAHEIKQPMRRRHQCQNVLRWLGRDEPDVAEAREAASRLVKDAMRAGRHHSKSACYSRRTAQRELVDVSELAPRNDCDVRSEANATRSRFARTCRGSPKVIADRVQL